MREKDEKKVFELLFYRKSSIKNSETCRNIFFYLHENGPTQRKTLINKLKRKDKVIWEALTKMTSAGIVEQLPAKGNKAVYRLTEKYRMMNFTQLLHFEKLCEKEEGVLWGYLGYGGLDEFMGNHTTYGLPNPKNLTDYERDMATMALKMIDTGFRALQEVKTLTEIRKKIEKESETDVLSQDGIFSYELTMEYFLFFLSRRIKQMALLSDNPYEFFRKVRQKALEILEEENGSKINELVIYEDHLQKYKVIEQQKSQCIESLFPKIASYNWKMDIAVLSTKILALTEEHYQNLEGILDKVIYQKNINRKNTNYNEKIKWMEYILRAILNSPVIKDWKINKYKFHEYEKLKDLFDEGEIETMTLVIDYYLNNKLKNIEGSSPPLSKEGFWNYTLSKQKLWEKPFHRFDIIHYILIYKLFQKGGPYYEKTVYEITEKLYKEIKKPYEKGYEKASDEIKKMHAGLFSEEQKKKIDEYLEAKIFIEKIVAEYLKIP